MANPDGALGGAFNPKTDYTFTGNLTFSGTTTFASGSAALIAPVLSGAATGSGSLSYVNTLTAAAYAASTHEDEIYSKVTLTPATTVTAANGLNAFRGEINLTSGKTLGSGAASYVTGVYGRGNIFGTVDIASGDLAAVLGKFDLNGSTLSSGHIAPVQSNIVNPPASAATTGAVALFYGESASGTKINAGLELYMASNFAFVMTDVNTSNFLPAISSVTLNGLNIKVQLNGTTYYIPTKAAA
jgi:hypothetical protein